jgi:uncharacterized protein
VADPTGTPLNVRTSPNGPVVNHFRNGTSVIIHDRQGQWAFAEDESAAIYASREGWVYFPYLTNCTRAGPSFNCTDVKAADQIAICRNADLSAADREMTKLYAANVKATHSTYRDYLQQTQTAWLISRRGCGYDAKCIDKLYEDRIAELGDGDIMLAEWCKAGHMSDIDCKWVRRQSK